MSLLKNVWKTDGYSWNLLTNDLERIFLEEVLDIDLKKNVTEEVQEWLYLVFPWSIFRLFFNFVFKAQNKLLLRVSCFRIYSSTWFPKFIRKQETLKNN